LNRTRGFANQNRFRSSKAVKKLGKVKPTSRKKGKLG
jgi:hypothetical protein